MGGVIFGFIATLLGGTIFGIIDWASITEFFTNLF